jgi:hypothetical protein
VNQRLADPGGRVAGNQDPGHSFKQNAINKACPACTGRAGRDGRIRRSLFVGKIDIEGRDARTGHRKSMACEPGAYLALQRTTYFFQKECR